MAFSGTYKWKSAGISSLYSPPCFTRFPVAKMSRAQWGRDKNMDTIMDISVAPTTSCLQWELVRVTATEFLSTLLVSSFKYCKHFPTSGFKLSYKRDFLILSLGFLLPSPVSWHTLRSITLYPNTLQ